VFQLSPDQIATLRAVHREAASAADPVAQLTANLHRGFTEEQRSRIAEDLEGYGRTFEGFAAAIACDFVPDEEDQMLESIREALTEQGFDVVMDE
jgi:hypothetical protein